MRRGFLTLCVGAWALCVAGCATESLQNASRPVPTWRSGAAETEAGQRFYVGIAVCDNVLDERAGRRGALINAAEQVAQSLEIKLNARFSQRTAVEGPLSKSHPKSGEIIKSEVMALSNQIILRLQPAEWYYEKWFVRESPFGNGFYRYRHFVLSKYPEEEYDRAMSGLIASVERRPEFILPKLQAALDAGKVGEAWNLAEQTTLYHSSNPKSWWCVYRVCKATGEWRKGIDALRKARALAVASDEIFLADEMLAEAHDLLAGQLREKARDLAKAGDAAAGLRTLEEAYHTARGPKLRESLRREYLDMIAETAAGGIAAAVKGPNAGRVALSAFVVADGHGNSEAEEVHEAVARKLRERHPGSVVVLDLNEHDVGGIARGEWRELASAQAMIEGRKVRWIVVGVVGETISIRLADVTRPETTIAASAYSLDRTAGGPGVPAGKAAKASAAAGDAEGAQAAARYPAHVGERRGEGEEAEEEEESGEVVVDPDFYFKSEQKRTKNEQSMIDCSDWALDIWHFLVAN